MVAVVVESLPLFRPRNPRASGLWQLLDRHFDAFRLVYDERFVEGARVSSDLWSSGPRERLLGTLAVSR